jgi:hypothetical protein
MVIVGCNFNVEFMGLIKMSLLHRNLFYTLPKNRIANHFPMLPMSVSLTNFLNI